MNGLPDEWPGAAPRAETAAWCIYVDLCIIVLASLTGPLFMDFTAEDTLWPALTPYASHQVGRETNVGTILIFRMYIFINKWSMSIYV